MAESLASTAIGFVVSMGILEGVNRVWGLDIGLVDNVAITSLFTVASVARSYLVRRWFNWYHHRSDADEELKARLNQRFEAQAAATQPGHYVRVPDGMSFRDAVRFLASIPPDPTWNQGEDIIDTLDESNSVRPVG
ncbi:MAG: hypothetical protein EHM18_02855 [Acidobacteria bacterium]|nr:MAG: hypothetical protein EHM18_02855 [Acidobacteriota bacterium]